MSSTATTPSDAPRRAARARSLRLLAVPVLSLVGAGISAYLTSIRLAHATPMCVVGHGCETVNSSPYAAIGDVPIAVLGLGLYSVIIALSLAALWGPEPVHAWAVLGIFGLALCGTLYSGYLTYIEVFILDALCPWCLTSAAIVTTVFCLACWTLVRPPSPFDG